MGNFNPLIGKTQPISATSTSSGITLAGDTDGGDIMLKNDGDVTVFYRTGETSATAVATTDTPILAGEIDIFALPRRHRYVAAITASGSTTLYVTPGSGD